MVQSVDHHSPLTGASPVVNLSKAGAAFGVATNSPATEVGSGWYKVVLSAVDVNTVGDLAFHITAASGDNVDFTDQVQSQIFTDLLLDVNGNVSVTSAFKKNIALNGLAFPMTDSSSHQLRSGLSVSAQISKDAATPVTTANAVTAIGGGLYTINLQASEMNANKVLLIFSATGADVRMIEFGTQP